MISCFLLVFSRSCLENNWPIVLTGAGPRDVGTNCSEKLRVKCRVIFDIVFKLSLRNINVIVEVVMLRRRSLAC